MRLIAIALMFWGGIFMMTIKGSMYLLVSNLGLLTAFVMGILFMWEYVRSCRAENLARMDRET